MSALSRLSLAASYFHGEEFKIWDRDTDAWSTGFEGRVYVFDRFKTIYHRPTRRETLGIARTITLPADLVIKHAPTEVVYMVSATDRTDVDNVNIYDRGRALHRSQDKGDLIRYATQGTGDNLGVLAAGDQGKVYYDTELRSESSDQMDYAIQQGDMVGRYFVTLPNSLPAEAGDYILASTGEYFRLDVLYKDSGYLLARATDLAPNHEDMVYELRTGEGGSYDPDTGRVIQAVRSDRAFSGYIGSLEKADQDVEGEINYDLEVWVDVAHIGFTPVPGDYVRARGLRYHVDKVTKSHSGVKYQLLCGRAAQLHNFSIAAAGLVLAGAIPELG
jgi:hypothetical protein